MTLKNRQEKKALHRGKIIRERLKFDLLEILKEIPVQFESYKRA